MSQDEGVPLGEIGSEAQNQSLVADPPLFLIEPFSLGGKPLCTHQWQIIKFMERNVVEMTEFTCSHGRKLE